MHTFGLLLGPPLLAAVLALVTVPFRPVVAWATATLSLASLGAALALACQVLGGEALVAGWQEILRAFMPKWILQLATVIGTQLKVLPDAAN